MGSTPNGYSASRAASICGVNPYQTKREIWQIICEERNPGFNEKNSYVLPIFEGNAATRWGTAFEDAIIKLAENKFDCNIQDREEFYSKKIGAIELTCHIDGNIYQKDDPLFGIWDGIHEGKTTNTRAYYSIKDEKQRWGDPGTDQVPIEYQIQCAVQRICTGADLVRLSVLVFPKTAEEWESEGWEIEHNNDLEGYILNNDNKDYFATPEVWGHVFEQIGNFHTYNLPSNPDLEAAIIKNLQEFDENHVKTEIPPEAKDYDDIRRLLTNPIGTIIATPELKQMAAEYSEIVRQTGEAGPLTKRKNQLKVEILDKMSNMKKDDWTDPPEKMILIDPDGGEILCNFSKSGFRSKRAK